ncbi:hypothetical protein F994_02432 [Acinetobacter bohemicus ANC 3994]|uniref:Uncharacterized protein n=1 Tax=Acinetobacter bohemicus ANC 3994 TaxID=1217715 RepID=N8QCI9_9GAMM|nr:hypothetical protein [Acinetobacter bohemicus]ENU19572.1 hypothetical protein F994_02432 [Acinetobacter bohemicus ANC 3994]
MTMKRVNQAVNAIAAGVQLFSEGVQRFSDLKELVSNFKANVHRNNKANLRRKNNENQPKYKPLFTDEIIKKVYLNPKMKLSDYGHFIIANGGYIAVVAVEGNIPDSRKSVVLEFKENSAMSIDDILQLLSTYPEATLIVNDNGEGKFLGQLLKKNGIWYMPVHWGGDCFSNDNRKEYVNKRAQAYACLSYAVNTHNFKICQPHNKEKVLKDLNSIRYSFDERSRVRIMPVSEMREIGLDAPDIADLFAYVFLENTTY